MNGLDVCGADGRVVGFCGGGEEGAEADVVWRLRNSGAGLGEAVGREADDFAWASEGAGFGHTHVVLADMGSIGSDLRNEVGVVVQDERHGVFAAESGQWAGDCWNIGFCGALGTELEELHTAFKHRQRGGSSVFGCHVSEIENAIEVSVGEIEGHG